MDVLLNLWKSAWGTGRTCLRRCSRACPLKHVRMSATGCSAHQQSITGARRWRITLEAGGKGETFTGSGSIHKQGSEWRLSELRGNTLTPGTIYPFDYLVLTCTCLRIFELSYTNTTTFKFVFNKIQLSLICWTCILSPSEMLRTYSHAMHAILKSQWQWVIFFCQEADCKDNL